MIIEISRSDIMNHQLLIGWRQISRKENDWRSSAYVTREMSEISTQDWGLTLWLKLEGPFFFFIKHIVHNKINMHLENRVDFQLISDNNSIDIEFQLLND